MPAVVNSEPTRPEYTWSLLAPEEASAGVLQRFGTWVLGLRVMVYEYEINRPRWEISGQCEGLWVCSLGHAPDVERAKLDGIRAAQRLAARGWKPVS